MTQHHDEEFYPITFREEDAKVLGTYLARRDSVDLIGMKRVGISNFLRFFIYHKEIVKTYIDPNQKHVYILVDLNNLIEIDIFPFWRLTLKRIADTVENYPALEPLRKNISNLFLKSIQVEDLFFTVDAVRDSLQQIVGLGFLPTIYFIRFDRLQKVVTPELFNNLQGIVDGTGQKLSYVFTSYRELNELSPKVFHKASLSTFAHKMYLKPASEQDMESIMDTLLKKYNFELDAETRKQIILNCGGHVQLLQLSLIIVNEMLSKSGKLPEDYIEQIAIEERIALQCDELYGTLTSNEQKVLLKIFHHQELSAEDKEYSAYLQNTGYIKKNGKKEVFSPFFANYLSNMDKYHKKAKVTLGLTKKEQMLYDSLLNNIDEICERDEIIQSVWPECNEIGVSDWALDRLVSRLRNKMKNNNSEYEIQTVKTRGFKLQKKTS